MIMDLPYRHGDLVWAKMKGYRPWPGMISTPSNNMKAPGYASAYHFIYFFGTNNCAWVKECNMMPYRKLKDEIIVNSTSTANFAYAVCQIEKYIKNPEFFGIESTQSVKEDKEKYRSQIDNGHESRAHECDDSVETEYLEEPIIRKLPRIDKVCSLSEIDYLNSDFEKVSQIENNINLKKDKKLEEPRIVDIIDLDSEEYEFVEKNMSKLASITEVKLERTDIFRCEHCTRGFVVRPEFELHRLTHHTDKSINSRIETPSKLFKTKIVTKQIIGSKPNSKEEPKSHEDDNNFQTQTVKPNPILNRNNKKLQSSNMTDDEKVNPGQVKCVSNAKVETPKKYNDIGKCERKYYIAKPEQDMTFERNDKNEYQCRKCNETFIQYRDALYHYWKHTGYKPYVCKICNKAFRHHKRVRCHIMAHSTGHNCLYCRESFATASQLRIHLNVHTGVGPYECQKCRRKFGDPGSLSYHKYKNESKCSDRNKRLSITVEYKV